MTEQKEEKSESEKIDELIKLRDNYEKIECNGISVKWDKKEGIFIIKLYDDKTKKTHYLVLDRRNLTPEQRTGLRAMAGMANTVLWESGESDDGPSMFQ